MRMSAYFSRRSAIAILASFFFLTLIFYFIYPFFITLTHTNSEEVAALMTTLSKPKLDERCRIWNSTHYQCLPNVFLIGASKSGTTSLYTHLMRHPNIDGVHRPLSRAHQRQNEVHRFDAPSFQNSVKDLELSLEWSCSPLVKHINASVVHYTPHYLYAPTVPYEMFGFYPNNQNLKFIILLRNPISRALSSYWFKMSAEFMQHDRGSIENLEANFRRGMRQRLRYERCIRGGMVHRRNSTTVLSYRERQNNFNALRSCFGDMFRSPELGVMHIDKGIYVDQLERWFDNFHPSSFFIESFENWSRDPIAVYSRMVEFIGQNVIGPNAFSSAKQLEFMTQSISNPTSNVKKREISKELEMELECFYRPYNEQLHKLIGRELFEINRTLDCSGQKSYSSHLR